MQDSKDIKAIIGLGNPGSQYVYTRHNIGFLIVDALAHAYDCTWQSKDCMDVATGVIADKKRVLVKPKTYMNTSGKVIAPLAKQGIHAENILVVHDELEKSFGHISIIHGGSARGHNGLRSLIECGGNDFYRLRFGIGRPEQKQDVGTYVLTRFSESEADLQLLIEQAVQKIIAFIAE